MDYSYGDPAVLAFVVIPVLLGLHSSGMRRRPGGEAGPTIDNRPSRARYRSGSGCLDGGHLGGGRQRLLRQWERTPFYGRE